MFLFLAKRSSFQKRVSKFTSKKFNEIDYCEHHYKHITIVISDA